MKRRGVQRPDDAVRAGRSEAGQRALDLLVTIPMLILTAPLFLLITIIIRLDSRGPAFFLQERAGRYGRPFRIIKFRTMRREAERLGSAITIGEDPRITRFGRVLRRSKLDELPQLINIALGEMSLVGPRPELPRYVALYDGKQRQILNFRPGLTGRASLLFRDEASLLAAQPDPERYYCDVQIPAKIDADLEYLENAGVQSDLCLLIETLRRVSGG